MISVILCKVSQPSLQKRKSYDETFVTAKSARINYGATLRVDISPRIPNRTLFKHVFFYISLLKKSAHLIAFASIILVIMFT